jgi:nitroreductase
VQFEELVRKARSYRRFSQKKLPEGFLKKMVEYARFSPSSGNMQFLKFLTIEKQENRARIFPILKWARALSDWDGPSEGERPTGYIVILLDKKIQKNPSCDHGIAAQTMLLGAAAEGVGCCIIGSYGKKTLSELLDLGEHLDPCLVLAFGYPGEIVALKDAEPGGKTSYYRDEENIHHVPKRTLKELIVSEK